MPVQIQSLTGGSPVPNFIESTDYRAVCRSVEEVKKRVVLIHGTSGQGKTQIGHRITNEWSENHTCRTFFFQTQTNDLYNASYSSILERNRWNQDSYWAPIPDRPKDYDFLKLCHYIKKKRSPSPEKILFHFDGLTDDEGRPTEETGKWKTKLYGMIRSFVSCAPAGMQLFVTVPMKPKNEELFVGNRVYIHTMEGFADDDIKTFFQRSLSHEPPEFLNSRVAEIAKKLGRSPHLYQVNVERFRSMGSDERELDDFLEELGDRRIEEKLLCLSYLRIWKVIIHFGQINIPATLFNAVLNYCCKTGSLGLSRTDNADEIFSIMRSEFLRGDFITEVRVGSNNQQIHWIIRTDVHSCLVELARNDMEEERQSYLTVGVMTMASRVDQYDRFHSGRRRFPDRYKNMLSQTALYTNITNDLMTNFSRYEKLTVYQLITIIHYAKLNKSGIALTDDDLEKFYNKVQQLERLLSFKGEQPREPEEESTNRRVCNVEYEPDTRTLYLQKEHDHECDETFRRRSSQLDEKTLEVRGKERDGKIEEHRAKEECGMLAEEQLKKLCEIVLVLGSDAYRQVYPLVVLANMYIILGKMRERVNGIEGRAEFWAQSPHDIFNHVRRNIFEVIKNVAITDFTQKVNIAFDDVLEDVNETSLQQKFERLDKLKKLWKHGFTNQEGLILLLNCIESLLEISENILKLEGKLFGGNGFEFIDPFKLWKESGLLKYQKKSGLDGDLLSESVRQKLVEQHGENAMFKDNKCLMSVVDAIQDGETVHITEDMLSISDKLVSDYAQEGMELITKLMGVIQTLYENSREKLNSWKQYSFVMRYVAMLMMKCGQMLEGFRYYTYALYSFYENTDKKKDKTVTDQQLIKMCKDVIKWETRKPFPGLAAQSVGKKLKGRCICFPLADGGDSKCDSCSDDGLYKNFLRERQGIETESDEEKKAIDILLAKLTAPVPPVDDEPARETAIGN